MRDHAAIRIASVPAAHPYVAHLADPAIVRLPDPPPPGARDGRWWPPVMLDPEWITANAAAFDVLHVHFGFESFRPDELRAAVAALRAAGRPLVLTVHDLENPQLAEQAPHAAALGVLVPAADALLTLTAAAAREIRRRWRREATVVAHPHVLPLDAPLPLGTAASTPLVGLQLRDLRPNVDGPGATRTLLEATADAPGAPRLAAHRVAVRVELRDAVRRPGERDAVRALCAAAPHATLVEAPRASDDALAAALADLDAVVLPYAHGTHSGWLELCWDLGVPVAAPRVGAFAEQHPDGAFLRSFTGAGELAAALDALLRGGTRPGSPERRSLIEQRRAGRRAALGPLLAAHREVYRAVG